MYWHSRKCLWPRRKSLYVLVCVCAIVLLLVWTDGEWINNENALFKNFFDRSVDPNEKQDTFEQNIEYNNHQIFERKNNRDDFFSEKRKKSHLFEGHNPKPQKDRDYTHFDFTNDSMPQIVEGWRAYADELQWKPLDILNMEPPHYLPQFRNPCFIGSDLNLQCLPHFMVIGTQKCGTTDLYDKIAIHPQVHRADEKEPFWWNRLRLKGETLEDYASIFSEATGKISMLQHTRNKKLFFPTVTGEASAGTIWDSYNWMYVPENSNVTEPTYLTQHLINHLLPNARFILILRNPTTRMYSDYKFFGNKHAMKVKISPEHFHERVEYGIKWLTECFQNLNRKHCLFDPPTRDRSSLRQWFQKGFFLDPVVRTRLGLYSEYLAEWNLVFPPEQTLVIRLEDYSVDRLGTLNQIFRHIGLRELPESYQEKLTSVENVQNSSHDLPMLNTTKKLLDDFHAPYNRKLAVMLNDERFLWN